MGFNLSQFLHNAIGDVGRSIGTVADAVVPGNQSNWHQPAAPPPPATTRPVQRQAAPSYPNFTQSNPLPRIQFPVLQAPKVNMPLEMAKQAVGGIGRDLVNSVTNIPVHLGLQAADMFNAATGHNDPSTRATYQASNPVTKAVFGTAPIKSYQGQAEDVSGQLQHAGVNPLLASAASVPLSGLFAAGDLSQFHIAGAAPKAISSAADAAAPIVGTAIKANKALGESGHAALNEPIGSKTLSGAKAMVKAVTPDNTTFGSKLNEIGQALGADVTHGPLKTADRIAEKATNDYAGDLSKVRDSVRGMLQVPNADDTQAHIDEISKHFPVTRVNQLDGSGTFGYKDTKVNIKLPSGHQGEIQLITPEMAQAKQAGHALYVQARTETNADKLAAFEDQMRNLYGQADAAAKARLASSADSSLPLKSASAGANGLPVAKTVPETVLPSETSRTTAPSTSKNLVYGDAISGAPSTPNVTRSGENVNLPLQNDSPPIVGTPLIKENKFTQSVKNSPEVSPEVKAEVSGQHAVRNTKQLMAAQRETIRTQGLDKATEDVLGKLSVPNGKTSDATLAQALEVAKAHDALGTEAGHSMATGLYDQISEHGVAKGQGVQILSQIARSSPAGLRNKAFKDLKKAGVEITPELKKEIQGHIDGIAKMPDGPAKDFAIAVLQKSVAKHLPQSKTGQAVSIWKAGLLSGVKTQGGNFVSNATFGALKKASDVPAAIVDKGLSLATGERTKTLTARGGSGVVEGAKNAKVTMKTGIDMRGVGDKYEQHAEINFKNPVMQKLIANPANMVFRGMNAADQPFWYGALKNSLYDQAKADGLTKGLKGKALTDHMDNLVANPTDKMAGVAEKDANKATLAYDTYASKGIQGIHQAIDQFHGGSKAGKAAAHTVVDVLAPFTKVPSAFLSRTVDFTPMGIGKEIFSQIAHTKFDQRSLATAIGEGATGTGVIAIGMALAQNGQLSGDYPSKDPKQAARWKAEHIIPNAVKIGGNWISMNYLGPIGLLFNAGSKIVEAGQGGAKASGQAAAALGGLGQGLLGQSFLQGFSGFSDAIKEPTKVASYLNSEAGSVVPSIVNDIGNSTDSMQRQANSVLDAIRARVPGLREQLAPKIDTFGNDLPQAAGGLNVALNPLKPSDDNHTPLLDELDRLAKTGSQNTVIPLVAKTIGSGPDAIKLTPDQVNQRQKLVGSQLTPVWNSIISSPDYGKLSDDQKATALQTALKDINSAVNRTMTSQIDSSKNAKAATGNTAAILSGHAPTAESYIQKALGKGTGTKVGSTNPAAKYATDLAKYQAAKTAGTLTGAKDLSTQKSLAREAVTSKFSSEVLSFYNLSKADQNAYFAQDKAKATDLYNQAKQLDGQLVSQTGASSKYKYGLGTKPKAAKKAKSVRQASAKKLNYTSRVAATPSSTARTSSALRNLVRGSKFSSSKVSKVPKLATYKVKLTKATKPRTIA